MLLALDFRNFAMAQLAVGFKDPQEIASFHGNMLRDIANENQPHVVFLSKP